MNKIFKTNVIVALGAMLMLSSCVVGTGTKSISRGGVKLKSVEGFASLDDFSSLKIEGRVDVKLIQSDSVRLDAKVPEGTDDSLSVNVVDGQLVVNYRAEGARIASANNEAAKITLACPSLDKIDIEGGSEIEAEGTWKSDSLDVRASGAAELDFENIQCSGKLSFRLKGAAEVEIDKATSEQMAMEVSGAGKLDLDGITTHQMNLDIRGASSVKVVNLKADDSYVDIAGASVVFIDFDNSGNATCDVSGASKLVLEGTLNSLKSQKSGACVVKTSSLEVKKK